jgi:hypothetical protein
MVSSKCCTTATAGKKNKSPSDSNQGDNSVPPELYHKTGNSWQQKHDLIFLLSNLPMYRRKSLQRKGKEFAAQCADQYFRLYQTQCKEVFAPSLGKDNPIVDLDGWREWKKKRTKVCLFFCARHFRLFILFVDN